ncbi:hypothetical protein FCV25MIE_04524 [Fagus crenata]
MGFDEGYVGCNQKNKLDLGVWELSKGDAKGTIVLCESPDDIVPLSNLIAVDHTWGSSSDLVLELCKGFGVMGPTVADQNFVRSFVTSDEESPSDDNIWLVWEDLEVVGDDNESVCWGDEVVPLEIELLATSKPEKDSIALGVSMKWQNFSMR